MDARGLDWWDLAMVEGRAQLHSMLYWSVALLCLALLCCLAKYGASMPVPFQPRDTSYLTTVVCIWNLHGLTIMKVTVYLQHCTDCHTVWHQHLEAARMLAANYHKVSICIRPSIYSIYISKLTPGNPNQRNSLCSPQAFEGYLTQYWRDT